MTIEDDDIVCFGTNDSSSHPLESIQIEDKTSDIVGGNDETGFDEIDHQRESRL